METTGAGTSIVSKRIFKIRLSKCVTCRGPFQAYDSTDITCLYLLYIFPLIGMKLYYPAYPLGLCLSQLFKTVSPVFNSPE